MEAHGGTATEHRPESDAQERYELPSMSLTFGGDFDSAKRCFDTLQAAGFEHLAMITLGKETGLAWAVEAYTTPSLPHGPIQRTLIATWWNKAEVDELARAAEESGADMRIMCLGGRMMARFT